MAIVMFVLSVGLLAAAAVGAWQSLDLLPTSMGMLYALSGAIAAVGAVLTFSLGLMTLKLDGVAALVRARLPDPAAAAPSPADETTSEAGPDEAAPAAAEPAAADEPEGAETEPAPSPAADEPLNENRAGHLPSLEAIETAIETPEGPPAVVGRYASGGANYVIFADGSIEAETVDGKFSFASMNDFRRYVLERDGQKAQG